MSRNQPVRSSEAVSCKGIDSSGCLGSLYDMRKDLILKGWNERTLRGSGTSLKSSDCAITHGTRDTGFNLLQFIDIEDELRLNLLLKTTRRIGIAAVMNYPRPIDESTRILYYTHVDRREQVMDMSEVSRMLELSDHQRIATHVITAINFGIDLVAVLKLQSNVDAVAYIDEILQNICLFLRSNRDYSTMPFTDEDLYFLDKNTSIAVYSNMACFTTLTRLSGVLHYVARIKNSNLYWPITYYLHQTRQFNPQYIHSVRNLSPSVIRSIEQCLLQLRTPIQYLKAFLRDYTPASFFGMLQNLVVLVQRQLPSLKDKYVMETIRFCHIMTNIRSGRCDASVVFSALRDDELSTLNTDIYQLIQHLNDSKGKKPSIRRSQPQPLQYAYSLEQHPFKNYSRRTTETTSVKYDQHIESVCFTYDKNPENDFKREDFVQIPVIVNRNNFNPPSEPSNHLYPVTQLQNMYLLNNIQHDESQLKSATPLPPATAQTPVLSVPSSSRTDQMINILLLGETGVGKSTFINAFANYLSFDTFEQAELNKPVVLIPVSFLMTVGDNFEERTVKFGDVEGLKNEDFSHPGQSVTQHCKSYIFHLDDGKKLCIIDTPGFGDTRGLEQDDRNMQNILEYIDNLTHLNAICFLLKPNSSRLNIFFRSCLTQILDLLGPKICKNLTFCFTNARSTFYTPGDSGPLLKNMLKSLQTEDIPFRKENTFCFDSESFRYLVALRHNIPFDEESKREYAMSWSTSVKESNRLIDYIRTKLVLHPQKSDWQSMKHAQFEINYMIRPILEAMRNILRNTILQNTGSPHKLIMLNPIVIHRSAFLCLVCKEKTTLIGKFWIAQDCPHEIQDACLNCPCASDQHIRIDYILNYEVKNTSNEFQNKTDDTINQLCRASAVFAYFLIHIAHSTHDDPFDSGLMRMIIQESELSDHHQSDNLNLQLTKELRELHAQYEQNIKRTKSNQEHIPLQDIYGLMNDVRQLPIIETQMNAVRWGREILMKQHENEHQEI